MVEYRAHIYAPVYGIQWQSTNGWQEEKPEDTRNGPQAERWEGEYSSGGRIVQVSTVLLFQYHRESDCIINSITIIVVAFVFVVQ